LIGFVPSSTVPRHHLLANPKIFEGNPEFQKSINILNHLIKNMIKKNIIGLVRVVLKNDDDPYLGTSCMVVCTSCIFVNVCICECI
jgi:hypothetical protein